MVPSCLSNHPVHPPDTCRCDCAVGPDDLEPRTQAALRAAQKGRALDLAALDVCFRDRRGDLPAPLPNLPATLIVYACPLFPAHSPAWTASGWANPGRGKTPRGGDRFA